MGWDVVVVGSGFGGSVSAGRLAERGMRVLVLERGPWWGAAQPFDGEVERQDFPRGPLGLRRALRGVRWSRGGRSGERLLVSTGLFELHLFDALTVVTGSGVGGGSLVYTNIQQEPEADFFAGLPAELTAEELAPFYGRVRSMLAPVPLPSAQRTSRDRSFAALAEGSGRGAVEYPDLAVYWGEVGPERHHREGSVQQACNHCGGCVLGCARASKTTMDLTYLPLALRHGAEVRPMSEVVGIGACRGGYQVRWLDHRTGQSMQVRAPRVVLAAGTLNTLRLLFTARDRHRALPGLPGSLGRHFSGNGDSGALLFGTRVEGESTRGASFNGFVRRRVGGERFLTGEVGLPAESLGLPAALRRAMDRVSMLISMGRDGARGTVGFDGRRILTSMARVDDEGLYAAIDAEVAGLADVYRARGAVSNLGVGSAARRLATVHPLGGASMGRGPEEGVVDHAGQVFGHRGLYVADGSIYPRAPGVPPSMTIAALAERIAELME